MIRKFLFILAHQLGDKNFYEIYRKLVGNQWRDYKELKLQQEKNLRYMVDYAYKNVPYYHELFKKLNISSDKIRHIKDLEKLPVLSKETIRKNWEKFKPVNLEKMKYYERATGGTTGTPLKYRISKFDRFLSGALLYRGWGYAGYNLGDKMVILGGSSLDISLKTNLITRAHEFARNIRKLSSFDMGENELRDYIKRINSFKPRFIRGYPSAIWYLAKYIEEHSLQVHEPIAVFTTAEKLFPHMREKIGEVFNCEVYDGYGANDGGISAFECPEHEGLHIDTERSVLEVIDDYGEQVEEGEGKVVATSLTNYAMPLLRYEVGDIAKILPENERCGCGRSFRMLEEVLGRSVDILFTPDGKAIHGWFFLYIFWENCTGVKEYQVVQESLNKILIKIVPDEDFDENQLERIKGDKWNLEFRFVEKIERSPSGKYKFIINKVQMNYD